MIQLRRITKWSVNNQLEKTVKEKTVLICDIYQEGG